MRSGKGAAGVPHGGPAAPTAGLLYQVAAGTLGPGPAAAQLLDGVLHGASGPRPNRGRSAAVPRPGGRRPRSAGPGNRSGDAPGPDLLTRLHQALAEATAGAGADSTGPAVPAVPADGPVTPADVGQAVWQLARAWPAASRELLELHVRAGLDGAHLAAVLAVTPAEAAHRTAMLREDLDRCTAEVLLARRGRRDCPPLDDLLRGGGDLLSEPVRAAMAAHAQSCSTCGRTRRMLVAFRRPGGADLPELPGPGTTPTPSPTPSPALGPSPAPAPLPGPAAVRPVPLTAAQVRVPPIPAAAPRTGPLPAAVPDPVLAPQGLVPPPSSPAPTTSPTPGATPSATTSPAPTTSPASSPAPTPSPAGPETGSGGPSRPRRATVWLSLLLLPVAVAAAVLVPTLPGARPTAAAPGTTAQPAVGGWGGGLPGTGDPGSTGLGQPFGSAPASGPAAPGSSPGASSPGATSSSASATSPAAPGRLTVSKSSIDFGCCGTTTTVKLGDAGPGPLTWKATASGSGLSVASRSGRLTAGHSATVKVSACRDCMAEGAFSGRIVLTVTETGQTITIPVRASVHHAPKFVNLVANPSTVKMPGHYDGPPVPTYCLGPRTTISFTVASSSAVTVQISGVQQPGTLTPASDGTYTQAIAFGDPKKDNPTGVYTATLTATDATGATTVGHVSVTGTTCY